LYPALPRHLAHQVEHRALYRRPKFAPRRTIQHQANRNGSDAAEGTHSICATIR